MKKTYKGRDGKLRFNNSNKLVHKWIAKKEAIKSAKNNNFFNLKIKNFFEVLIFVVATLSLIGANQFLINKIINFFIGLIISAYYSMVANSIAERSRLAFLKKYKFTIEIWKFKFSKTAFAIIAILIEWLLLK